MDKIIDHLYLSSVSEARNFDLLNQNNITHILTIADIKPRFPKHFIYKVISIPDLLTIKIDNYFETSFKFIEDAIKNEGNVLVHCHAGISRSPTIIIAYLIWKYGLPYSLAKKIVLKQRNFIDPNEGFDNILRKFSYEMNGQF